MVFLQFPFALVALFGDPIFAIRLMLAYCEPVEDLVAAIEGTLYQPEIARVITVLHQFVQKQIVLATF